MRWRHLPLRAARTFTVSLQGTDAVQATARCSPLTNQRTLVERSLRVLRRSEGTPNADGTYPGRGFDLQCLHSEELRKRGKQSCAEISAWTKVA